MTSGRAGGLKICESLKADSPRGPPEGSLRRRARPGSKGLVLKNHEAPSISWTGRAIEMRNAECGMRNGKKESKSFRIPDSEFRIWQGPIGPPHPAEAGRSLQEEGQPGRCFLRTRPLPPGHNSSIREMSNSVSPWHSRGGLPGGNYKFHNGLFHLTHVHSGNV